MQVIQLSQSIKKQLIPLIAVPDPTNVVVDEADVDRVERPSMALQFYGAV